MDEVLNKAELKKIIGGNGSDPWPEVYYCSCYIAEGGVDSDWYTVWSVSERDSLFGNFEQNCESYNCALVS